MVRVAGPGTTAAGPANQSSEAGFDFLVGLSSPSEGGAPIELFSSSQSSSPLTPSSGSRVLDLGLAVLPSASATTPFISLLISAPSAPYSSPSKLLRRLASRVLV